MNTYKNIKKYSLLLATAGVLSFGQSCTNKFEEINTNPVGVTDEQANADYALIASFMAQAQRDIIPETVGEYQLANNLCSDAFSGYFGAQAPFVGNANNLTYSIVPGWLGAIWTDRYIKAMNPLYRVIELTREDQALQDIYAFALVLKVAAMHRTSDKVGPIIYSQYNITNAAGGVSYDAQADVYTAFFSDLDAATGILLGIKDNAASAAMEKSDLAYTSNRYTRWLKFANTLRLRLALRIAYVNPTLAKTEGEKALDPANGGLLEEVADNCYVTLSVDHPLNIITSSWSDTRMGAPFESILRGYNDPRLPKLFLPATDPAVVGQYKGIRSGINIDAKSRYDNYSKLQPQAQKTQLMVASESWFLKAEAALRGWNNAGNAQTNYETGIDRSFEMYGLSASAAAYKSDASSAALPYVDPKALNRGENDVPASSPYLSKITIKWDEGASNSEKLERIITQKWIAIFPDGDEAWAEYRRTGYPILFPVVVNYSNGAILTPPGIRRMPYPQREYNSNSAAVAEAVNMLGGADNGGTRLWWDVVDKTF